MLQLYRFLSYVLMPIVALLGMLDFLMLFTALANPPLLLPVFILACVVIYVITTFNFLNNGVIHGKPRKPSLKDWIKVNAIVSIVFATMALIQSVMGLANPGLLNQVANQALAMQPNATTVPKEMLLKMMKGILWFLTIISVILLTHVFITFRLIKQYRHIFSGDQQ